MFTSQSTAVFYDRLFSTLDYKLPRAVTGRKGFPKEAMLCAFLVMKCEGFSQISDLVDYLENNRLIAYYCGFNIMKPLPSYWTYARFLRQVNNSELKEIMAALVRKLYDEGIVDTKPFRMITDFLLTEAACRSNEPMLCGLSVNVIIHASNAPDRNASGFTTA